MRHDRRKSPHAQKVSRTTVSHVVNHSDRVSKALRERVEKVIAELGYTPNPQARSLRTGRTNIVAMLIADIVNPFFPGTGRDTRNPSSSRWAWTC